VREAKYFERGGNSRQEYKIGKYIMVVSLGNLKNSWAASIYKSPTITDNDALKSFVGARQGLGVGYFCYAGEGPMNGMAPAYYVKDETGALVEGSRSLDFYS